MNVLILTAKFGMGHVNVAEAIKEETLEKDSKANVTILDFCEYLFPYYYKIMYYNFNFAVSKVPPVYEVVNTLIKKAISLPLDPISINKIDKLLDEYKPDIVIATYPMGARYISAYKEIKDINLPLYTYITDLAIKDEWLYKNTDLYFVGADYTKNLLVTKGINPQQIVVSGIPVRKNFNNKKLHKKGTNKTEILIMGGGLGLIPISPRLLNLLLENNNNHITIITGKNIRFKKYLLKKYPMINTIGYTKDVYRFMKKADVIITKPGGITTFEAINMGTPLYVFKPFLSQEKGNAKYIEEQNIGRIIDYDSEQDIVSFLENDKLLDDMKKNMYNIKCNWESDNILNYCNKKDNK
jgi:processive 1,2-diacylglycerol beta-glucosyltransferase